MRKQRKHYDKDFKAKVALEAIGGEKTVQEIATSYAVHPNLVSVWKKQLLESAGTIFEKEGKDKEVQAAERRQEELYKQIGQLQVENESLKNAQEIVRDRAVAVDPDHPKLSISRQCELLGISRSAYYYAPRESGDDRELTVLLAIMDELRNTGSTGIARLRSRLPFSGLLESRSGGS